VFSSIFTISDVPCTLGMVIWLLGPVAPLVLMLHVNRTARSTYLCCRAAGVMLNVVWTHPAAISFHGRQACSACLERSWSCMRKTCAADTLSADPAGSLQMVSAAAMVHAVAAGNSALLPPALTIYTTQLSHSRAFVLMSALPFCRSPLWMRPPSSTPCSAWVPTWL
jgi:hypothetical protein